MNNKVDVFELYPFFNPIKNRNFSNPLLSRKWLSLLEKDRISNIRIKKYLRIKSDYLGFSFNSNEFGLRGESNEYSNTVFAGTSYTMGFSVDIGFNWYDYLKPNEYFNIGLPVGAYEQYQLIHKLYKGNYKHLCIIYFPNFWSIGKVYQNSNNCVFTYKKWRTGRIDALFLYHKRIMDFINGETKIISVYYDNKKYFLNRRYSYFNFKDTKSINYQLKYWEKIINMFENITILRIPAKEELYNNMDSELIDNINLGWDIFRNSFSCKKCECINLSPYFSLNNYLPCDTHWNKVGNHIFFQLLKEFLYEKIY